MQKIIYQNSMLPRVNPELWNYLKRSGFTDGEPSGHSFSLKMHDGSYGKFFSAKHFVLILGSSMWRNSIAFIKVTPTGNYQVKGMETLPFLEDVDSFFLDYGVTDEKLKDYSKFYKEFFVHLIQSLDDDVRTSFAGDHLFTNISSARTNAQAIVKRLCKKFQIKEIG